MADLANEEKPAIAPPVFVFQKDKGQKVRGRGQLAAPVLKAEKILTEKMEITALLSSEKEHPL
ncbi:RAN binding protein 3 [Homo sapiens]|uniref:RAN binding protein 3 n=1 Tax=Homo sapiens TaxID=9606 RepID=K7ENJ2_HUMAN|nr:RAN binding protein 3 [Homo sapiens]KAI4039849.1 RAN binding protein 3 [Homo sapiens]